ncbi:hypothetical protein PMI01_01629 [Caulobacter sp. AP07]|uniref:hypothetical protein n=1 Tax=Caulobacter sp. AP07 TaxID=1144304 RepID=UPI00027224F1|nr:hypothetical protein [Caulobacter sp. AP07]EJL34421.1 hypothetical protein PMI01_01629 [Caulobacter sp. AP07]
MLISGSSIMASLAMPTLNKINQATAAATTKATDATSASGMTAAPEKTAKDEFLDYAKMTPAEKMRAAMLKRMGLTEDDVKAMSADERQRLEDQIKQQIKEQVMNDPKMKTGSLLDVSA